MRANLYDWDDREAIVSKYSEKLARLYKAQVDLYKLIIADAETSQIEAAVDRVAMLSFELTAMPDIPETMKDWHEQITGKAFPKNAISGSPDSTARRAAPPAAGSGMPGSARAPGAAPLRTGLEAWFCVPGRAAETAKPPHRWRQWLVSLAAAYPLVLLFQAFIAPQIKDWPLEAKSALLPLCVLTVLTYVVMPPVSRLLRGWPHSSSRARRRGRSRQQISGTVAARVCPRRDGRRRTPARCWPGKPVTPEFRGQSS